MILCKTIVRGLLNTTWDQNKMVFIYVEDVIFNLYDMLDKAWKTKNIVQQIS